MGRRSTKVHYQVGEGTKMGSQGEYKTLLTKCGDAFSSGLSNWLTTDLNRVSCPECSAALGKERLKELAAQGTTITLEKRAPEKKGQFSSKKSVYEVKINGELTGFITIDNGWGCKWVLHNLRPFSTDPSPHRDNTVSKGGAHSKEFLAASIPDLIAQNKHPSKATVDQEAADREAVRARLNAARDERHRAALEARRATQALVNDTTKGLEELLATGKLSNLETEHVHNAIKLIADAAGRTAE